MSEGKILLVRHGQTAANIDQVWHGHTDTALTELGEQQAERLGAYFHNYLPEVHAIYASPLQRAKHTAQRIAAATGHDLRIDPRLMEFGVGELEGKSFVELDGENGFVRRMMADEHHRAPGGESRHDVTRRFVTAVEEFRQNHPGENIVVVSHGLAIAFGLSHWIDRDSTRWTRYRVNNTSVTEVCLNRFEIGFLDRIDHLNSSR
ncbi:MAG: histidine phosphatase family protein [Porticoccaceae bacterium]